MNRKLTLGLYAVAVLFMASTLIIAGPGFLPDEKEDSAPNEENSPSSVQEARSRSRILHETIHGSLQVMHRDFFDKDEAVKIPSKSLEDVFSELTKSYGVECNWIAVDLKAMNVDNEPKTKFEQAAANALRSGKNEFEKIENGKFQFAGRIKLSATCLSCHASRRSNNDDRAAGLVIIMPLSKPK